MSKSSYKYNKKPEEQDVPEEEQLSEVESVKNNSYKAVLISDVWVWYYNEEGHLQKTVNRWKGLKEGDTFFM